MKESEQKAILVADLGYGDAGKGTITDYLTRNLGAHTVIRYNGGAQAGHNVITPEGKHHKFAQFGSGTFVDGVKTHLSKFVLVEPLSMLKEERHLQDLGIFDALSRTTIDKEAVVITPLHRAVNRLKEEALGDNRHGSCGMGNSEAIADYLAFGNNVLLTQDLPDRDITIRKLQFLKDIQLEKIKVFKDNLPYTQLVQEELNILQDPKIIPYSADIYSYFASRVGIVDMEYLSKILKASGVVIFEGSQGVLLDEHFGFYPHITHSDITFKFADFLLSEQDYQGQKTRLGLARAYATRHGAGPFVTEDPILTASLPDMHNTTNRWQGGFRVGYFDAVSTSYAIDAVDGIDFLAITNVDRLSSAAQWKICQSYHYDGPEKNVSGYFEIENETVKRIKCCKHPRVDHQSRLTQLLSGCSPNYLSVPHENHTLKYVFLLEDLLGVPIKILSAGPTAKEKIGTI